MRYREAGPGALLLCIATIAATLMPRVDARAAEPLPVFDIPAGEAQCTLLQFYLQSRVQLLYLSDAVSGVRTRAIHGAYSPAAALSRMLAGTGLSFEFESDSTAVIRVSAQSLSDSASYQGGGTERASSFGKKTEPGDPVRPALRPVDELLVTGSYIRGVLDVASPLQVVDRKQMKGTAYATVQDALRNMPVNAGAAQGEVFGGAGNHARGSAANLRGLGAGATLVLINGRRQPQAGLQADFVDVSNIPWSAVERIEVLPDGTSALYGSDAIAGVVNIIMRDTLEGMETQLRHGAAADGAVETLAAQLFGHDWGSGKWLFAYQYSNRTRLAAADRAYTADTDKRALGGSDYSSFRSNPGNILDFATLAPVLAIPRGQDGTSLGSQDLLPDTINTGNAFATRQLLPDKEIHSAFLTASQQVGTGLDLFGEARYSRRRVNWQGSAEERLLLVPPSNAFFVDGIDRTRPLLVAYSFLDDLGPLRNASTAENFGAAAGLRADIASWQTTLSGAYVREALRYTGSNFVDTLALSAALSDPSPATAFNPFGEGSHTNPATLESIRGAQRNRAASQILSANLVADGPLLDLPAGILKLAVGAEHRRERFNRTLGGPAQNYLRRISAAFAELSVPLIGNPDDSRDTPQLELSVASRYERYSDFGSTFNPKIGMLWIPHESIKLRSSWGTSFKAPKLIELYDSSQNAAAFTLLADPLSPGGQSIVLVLQGNNRDLNEERATTWTAGIDFTPRVLSGLTVSLTAYSITYEDQVILPAYLSPLEILLQEERWSAAIERNPTRAQVDPICDAPLFFGSREQCRTTLPTALIDYRLKNLAATTTRGLDVRLEHALPTSMGIFNVNLNGGYIFSFEQAFTQTSPAAELAGLTNNPSKFRLHGTVEWSERGWKQPGLGVSLTLDHAAGSRNPGSNSRPTVSSWTTTDLQLRYRTRHQEAWHDNLELSLNAVNVFDEDPPFVDQQWGYDYLNAEPFGRVISLYVQKSW